MNSSIPQEIAPQLDAALAVLRRHLGGDLKAVHLFGSAVDGGLKPHSDIDLLVTVAVPPGEAVRHALMRDLLAVSAPPGAGDALRPLEVTVVALERVVPGRYPAVRELQFGEWLRADIDDGAFEPPQADHDLAILLTKARQHSVALAGPPADALLAAVPRADFALALADTTAQWNEPDDWQGDERNIVLALARIWYSVHTGAIAAKDVAAGWALERLPPAQRAVLADARTAYLIGADDDLAARQQDVAAFVRHVKAAIDADRAAVQGNAG
jgi:streptomycin 3"-adenylyltransferase